MSHDALCEHPSHAGDRYLQDRRDLWEERLEYRHVVSQSRGPTRVRRRVCRECMTRDVAEIDNVGPATEALFP